VAIIFDGRRWYIRRIRVIEHDGIRDEMVYRCDRPIANNLRSLRAASKRLAGGQG